MLPAETWSSVEERLLRRAAQARTQPRTQYEQANDFSTYLMVAGGLRDFLQRSRPPAPLDTPIYSVAAFVFCQPGSGPAKQLLASKSYFDARTGDTWDLFFPGYFAYGSMNDPHQIKFDDDWGFSPTAFDQFRAELERKVHSRWRYSGGSDLVLMNMVAVDSHVTVDFQSVLSGPLTEPADNTASLTLAQVIERISQDLQNGSESSNYGVDEVVRPREFAASGESVARTTLIAAAGGILAEIGANVLGLKP